MILLAVITSGCAGRYSRHSGPNLNYIDYQGLKVGFTKNEVLDLVGTPNFIGENGNWYYIDYNSSKNLVFSRRRYAAHILELVFSDQRLIDHNIINSEGTKKKSLVPESKLFSLNDGVGAQLKLMFHSIKPGMNSN